MNTAGQSVAESHEPAEADASEATVGAALLERYGQTLLQVFGTPQLVLDHGEGSYVYDVDGRRYLDLLGGIAVNSVGHAHPRLVSAVSEQASRFIHVSNFFTTSAQIELAERILHLAQAPEGSAVFFANSGTEAVEAAIKLARRTGKHGLLACEGAFHGRSTGALALTAKAAYREPFGPLLPGVARIPFGDEVALKQAFCDAADEAARLRAAGDESGAAAAAIGALIIEAVQGEAGVIPASPEYLQAARRITREHGALLIIDEIQTGVGRTGSWFAFQQADVIPDAFTLAKGLGGGVPIGALVTLGETTSRLLGAGQHGSTFGGNPLACAAGLAVLDILGEFVEPGSPSWALPSITARGQRLRDRLMDAAHPLILETRGAGLLIGIGLTEAIAPQVAAAALAAGFIINAPNATTLRLAPSLLVSDAELDTFSDALPGILDAVQGATRP